MIASLLTKGRHSPSVQTFKRERLPRSGEGARLRHVVKVSKSTTTLPPRRGFTPPSAEANERQIHRCRRRRLSGPNVANKLSREGSIFHGTLKSATCSHTGKPTRREGRAALSFTPPFDVGRTSDLIDSALNFFAVCATRSKWLETEAVIITLPFPPSYLYPRNGCVNNSVVGHKKRS